MCILSKKYYHLFNIRDTILKSCNHTLKRKITKNKLTIDQVVTLQFVKRTFSPTNVIIYLTLEIQLQNRAIIHIYIYPSKERKIRKQRRSDAERHRDASILAIDWEAQRRET